TLGAAATIGEAVLLALALRALAVAVGHPKLGRRAVAYARLLVIFTMIGILLNLLCIPLVQLLEVVLRGSLARNIETSLPLLLLVGELLCSLILLVQFVELVGNTRQAVVGTYESASAHD
ncbi:MAG TPA: hypothetical protein VEL76_14140, partial [Gemmataceae bacterium]|nr:hypothetical protein [Gemmataceae bacterium]